MATSSDSTQFAKDLADPQAGLNSDLYSAISPMISADSQDDLRGGEAAKINKLKEQVRKGLVGLEYMVGNKKNTGETFYDEHPVQALATDALSKSPLVGLGLAGGGMLLNSIRQKQNLDKTIPASDARMGNSPAHDASHPAALLNPREGDVRGDIARIYGNADSQERMQLIDRLSGMKDTDPQSFTSRHTNASSARKALEDPTTNEAKLLKQFQDRLNRIDPSAKDSKSTASVLNTKIQALSKDIDSKKSKASKELADLLASARQSEGHKHLESQVNFHEALRRAGEKGGFKGSAGSDLPLPDFLKADKHQGIVDLAEKLNNTKSHKGFDQDLMLKSVGEFLNDPEKLEQFKKHSLPKLTDLEHQGSGLRRFLSRHKTPLAIGGAAALGGTGLYHLVKAIQNQMYSKDKMNEWKKTLLKSKGDFDAANQIQ